MPSRRPLSLLVLVAALVPTTACIVNNNQSPGANGTIAPTVTIAPQAAVAMPGATAQLSATTSSSAAV